MAGPLDLLLDDAGRGIEIHVGSPLSPACQRLMATLGVRVVVMSATISGVARCNIGDCEWSHEGTSVECAEAGETHRAAEHSWIRSDRYVTFIASDVPALPVVSSEDALAALDAGVPQRTLYPAEIELRLCATPNCDREAGTRSFYCDICRADRDRRRAAALAKLAPEPEPAPEPAPVPKEEPPVTTIIGWTRERIIDAIRAWNDQEGKPPTSAEWAAAEDGHPSAGQVARTFGTWADGIEAAGFPRPSRGGSRPSASPPAAERPPAPPEPDEAPGASQGVEEAQAEGDVHWFTAWKGSLPIDLVALNAQKARLEEEIAQNQLRIATIERILGVLSEELVEPE